MKVNQVTTHFLISINISKASIDCDSSQITVLDDLAIYFGLMVGTP